VTRAHSAMIAATRPVRLALNPPARWGACAMRSRANGSWVMTSYLCASAIMATLTGWLRRRYGARPLFIGSIGLFIIASGLCAIAPSYVALMPFRLVQGAAAGVIQPLAQAILLDIYPQRDHGRMLAIWGATIMAGPILGPVLGGVIADLTSWRWIFVLNLPLGLIATLGVGQVPTTIEPTAKARMTASASRC